MSAKPERQRQRHVERLAAGQRARVPVPAGVLVEHPQAQPGAGVPAARIGVFQPVAAFGDPAQLRVGGRHDVGEPAHQHVGGQLHPQLVLTQAGHQVAQPDRRCGVGQHPRAAAGRGGQPAPRGCGPPASRSVAAPCARARLVLGPLGQPDLARPARPGRSGSRIQLRIGQFGACPAGRSPPRPGRRSSRSRPAQSPALPGSRRQRCQSACAAKPASGPSNPASDSASAKADTGLRSPPRWPPPRWRWQRPRAPSTWNSRGQRRHPLGHARVAARACCTASSSRSMVPASPAARSASLASCRDAGLHPLGQLGQLPLDLGQLGVERPAVWPASACGRGQRGGGLGQPALGQLRA